MAKSYLNTYTLNNIIHQMENGSISTAAFQRGFVWGKKLVKKLFESINNGYPIGMLLAFKGDANHFVRSSTELSYFPDPNLEGYESYRTLWILDGSQRLAALYSVLRGKQRSLDLYYDLVHREFCYSRDDIPSVDWLKMSSLFDPKEFMKYQAYLAQLENSDELMNELNSIHKRFQDYEIPVQVIEDVSDSEIIDIFTSLNTSGLSLRKEEVDKANKHNKPNK